MKITIKCLKTEVFEKFKTLNAYKHSGFTARPHQLNSVLSVTIFCGKGVWLGGWGKKTEPKKKCSKEKQ